MSFTLLTFFFSFSFFPFFSKDFMRIWVYGGHPSGVDVRPSREAKQGSQREGENKPDMGLFCALDFFRRKRAIESKTRDEKGAPAL